MGTNYYARIIPTKERKTALKKMIDQETDYSKILDEVALTFGMPGTYVWQGGRIHLGKLSGGWKFLWNPNQWRVNEGDYDMEARVFHDKWVVKKYYDLTKESIKAFLLRPDVVLVDEYGEEYPDKAAWFEEMVKRDSSLWRDKDPMLDGKLYYERYPQERGLRHIDDREKMWQELGYETTGHFDFYSDGLRFSTSVEFS